MQRQPSCISAAYSVRARTRGAWIARSLAIAALALGTGGCARSSASEEVLEEPAPTREPPSIIIAPGPDEPNRPRPGRQDAAASQAIDGGLAAQPTEPLDAAAEAVAEGDGGTPAADAAADPGDGARAGHDVTPAACSPHAYVSNSFSDSVSVIDTRTHAVVATVPTGKAPVNPTFTPDRRHVYVANSQADTLTVIDVASHETKTIPAGGPSPSGLAFSPDGRTLWVSRIGPYFVAPGSVISIDLETGTVSPAIPMGADPERIALTPDGSRLFVNNLLGGTMAVVDTARNEVTATIALGALPFNPLMSPDGSTVYVGVMSANHIAVVDARSTQIVRTIPADSPNGLAFSADGARMIVSNALSGTVQEVSLLTDEIVRTQKLGGIPGNVAVLPDARHAYMVRPDGTTVEVLDLRTLTSVHTIEVGTGPSVVSVCHGASAS